MLNYNKTYTHLLINRKLIFKTINYNNTKLLYKTHLY